MEIYRQGDIILCPVENDICVGCGSKTEKAKIMLAMTNEAVLARGEATGHSHRLIGSVKHYGNTVQVMKRPATLTHEDHGEPRSVATGQPVKVAPGTYHVHQQQVMDYTPPKPEPRYYVD